MQKYLKSFTITLVFSMIVFAVLAQMRETRFRKFSVQEGLSQSVVTAIFQDSQGFMWFGTQDGLNRYDGYSFLHFKHNDTVNTSISGNYIRCIYEDSDGFLWIGTAENGLNRYSQADQSFNQYSIDNKKSERDLESTILCIMEDHNKQLWVGTSEGLLKFYPQKNTFEKLPLDIIFDFKASENIKTLFEDAQKQLWIGTDNGLVCFNSNRDKITVYNTETSKGKLVDNDIHEIFEAEKNILLIGTSNGLSIFDLSEMDFVQSYKGLNSEKHLTFNEVGAIAKDKRGTLWIGTFGNGLFNYNLKTKKLKRYFASPGKNKTLSNDYVLSLYIDKSGLLWIGTYGGGIDLLELLKIEFNNISKANKGTSGLANNDVYAITQSRGGYLWFGTANGLSIYQPQTNTFTTVKHENDDNQSLSSNIIYSLLRDFDNNIWIGTDGGGLNKVQLNEKLPEKLCFQHYRENDSDSASICSDQIFCLFQNRNDSLIWAGTDNGIAVIKPNGKMTLKFSYIENDSTTLSNNSVQAIKQTGDGTIFVATYNGLNEYIPERKEFKRHENPNGRSSNTVYSICEDKNKLIWLGTDNGLYNFDKKNETFKRFTKEDGMPDNVIYGIIADDENNLWLSTNKGLSRMIGQHKQVEYTFINYNTNNWLSCNAFNIGAYYKNSDGMIFFGCDNGVTVFHPDNVKGNYYQPPVIITDFQLFFEPVRISKDYTTPLTKNIEVTKSIVLTAKQNVLSFGFTALNFIQSEKNEYAYMMEGFDDKWRYIQDRRNATYTNLDPGKYTFRVKASNNNGIWNEQGTSISIEILPPFYKKWWFYLIIAAGAIIFIILLIHLRTKGLAKMQKILQQKVKERTAEVERQKHEVQEKAILLKQANEELNATNEELNTTLDHMKAMQSQLVQSEKMASLGQLTAGIAHEINNPINFVNGSIFPLQRDIDDIINILDQYEHFIEKQKLKSHFKEVEKLKEELEADFLIDEIHSLLDGIKEGADRTTAIVKGLRNFSRLDEDDMKLANLNEGIESTLLILNNKLKQKVTIKKDLGEIPEIICYPGKINQVFMNIINNACDAIEKTGTIFIKSEKANEHIIIRIKDNGYGMPQKVKERIFEPFYTTKDVGEGTGLGLSISFGIIENHKGKIEVESEPGKGTEFIISLPLVQDMSKIQTP